MQAKAIEEFQRPDRSRRRKELTEPEPNRLTRRRVLDPAPLRHTPTLVQQLAHQRIIDIVRDSSNVHWDDSDGQKRDVNDGLRGGPRCPGQDWIIGRALSTLITISRVGSDQQQQRFLTCAGGPDNVACGAGAGDVAAAGGGGGGGCCCWSSVVGGGGGGGCCCCCVGGGGGGCCCVGGGGGGGG